MAILKDAWTYGTQVVSNMWRGPRKYGDSWFYPVNVGTFNQIENLKSFLEIPEVGAVITRKAMGYSNGIFKVVNNNGVQKNNDPINKRLIKPNWFQSQKEFMMQTCLFHEIFGDEYLYLFTGMKTPRADNISGLYTLPPNLVECKYKDTVPFFLFGADERPNIEYTVQCNGKKLPIDQIKLIHLNENRVSIKDTTDEDLMHGTSQLQGLRAPINNIRMCYNSRGAILKHRGALGMMTPDNKDALGKAIALEEPEIENVQKRYQQTYGGLDNQFQIFITNVPMKWQQMGVNPDKLGLFDETKEDFAKIKDAYQAPDELFSNPKGVTYENQNAAWKRWYENAIIPDANERMGALNDVLMVDSNYKIVVDYSHLPIFQEDIKHRSEALTEYVNALSAMLSDKQITSDEYRAEIKRVFTIGTGTAIPVEKPSEENQDVETRSAQAALRGSVGGVQGILAIQASVAAGTTTLDSGLNMLTIVFGFDDADASALLGTPEPTATTVQPTEQQTALVEEAKALMKQLELNPINRIKLINNYGKERK